MDRYIDGHIDKQTCGQIDRQVDRWRCETQTQQLDGSHGMCCCEVQDCIRFGRRYMASNGAEDEKTAQNMANGGESYGAWNDRTQQCSPAVPESVDCDQSHGAWSNRSQNGAMVAPECPESGGVEEEWRRRTSFIRNLTTPLWRGGEIHDSLCLCLWWLVDLKNALSGTNNYTPKDMVIIKTYEYKHHTSQKDQSFQTLVLYCCSFIDFFIICQHTLLPEGYGSTHKSTVRVPGTISVPVNNYLVAEWILLYTTIRSVVVYKYVSIEILVSK